MGITNIANIVMTGADTYTNQSLIRHTNPNLNFHAKRNAQDRIYRGFGAPSNSVNNS
jgi:hypothetical protein